MKVSVVIGGIVVAAIVLLGFRWFDSLVAQQPVSVFPPIVVAAVVVTPSDLPRSISTIGTIEAVKQALISAEVSGRIENFYFRAGQQVEKGELLLQIDDAGEQADLQQYNAELNAAIKKLELTQKLKDLASSQSRVDERKMAVVQSQANVSRTLAVIEKKRLEAPFAGLLGIHKVRQGEFVTPGTAIVTLTDTSQYLLNFSIAERLLPQISIGQSVELSVDAIAEKNFFATIDSIEPQVNQNTHTVLVQAYLDETDIALYPGMFAHVSVQLPPHKQVLILPETAVQTTTYGNSVYVVIESPQMGYTVSRVAVKTGQRVDGKVVIEQGIKAGDTVVISGQNRLRDGAAVTFPLDRLKTLEPELTSNLRKKN